jgi:hypothetical protein
MPTELMVVWSYWCSVTDVKFKRRLVVYLLVLGW